jgi:lipopolysaccharide/colanic/teichoic acid biosynthesis glycosyltransferase
MYEHLVKRLFDIFFSVLLLVLVFPVFLFVCIGILSTMPGPVFFLQERIGKHRKIFLVYKFRSMKVDRQAELTHDFSKDAERITRFGKFLRRSKIDELPQLYNVIKGDMSLVGPRPTLGEQVALYDSFQMRRLSVKPGMTGLAQVHGCCAISWSDRIKYDVYYTQHLSFVLDLYVLFKTFAIVFLGEEHVAENYRYRHMKGSL